MYVYEYVIEDNANYGTETGMVDIRCYISIHQLYREFVSFALCLQIHLVITGRY